MITIFFFIKQLPELISPFSDKYFDSSIYCTNLKINHANYTKIYAPPKILLATTEKMPGEIFFLPLVFYKLQIFVAFHQKLNFVRLNFPCSMLLCYKTTQNHELLRKK